MAPLERTLIEGGARRGCAAGCCCGCCGRLVNQSYTGSRVVSRLRRGQASVDVRGSVFCTVRDPVPRPLCGFYVAAFTRLHALFDLTARVEVSSCRGMGQPACLMTFAPSDNRAASGSAVE